jgi:hypothetical protein
MATILMGNTHAKSPSSDTGDMSASGKVKKAPHTKTAHVGQIKFLQGSEETTKERSSRLKRECKGGVNAGACAGYTR